MFDVQQPKINAQANESAPESGSKPASDTNLFAGIVFVIVTFALALGGWIYLDSRSSQFGPDGLPDFEGTHKPLVWRDQPFPVLSHQVEELHHGRWQNRDLADITKGRVSLINFWASWCVPCLTELPGLNQLQGDFDKEDFQVIALSLDLPQDQRDALQVWQRLRMSNISMFQDVGTLGATGIERFAVDTFPTSLLVDRNGQIVASLIGEADWDSSGARTVVSFLIDQSNH